MHLMMMETVSLMDEMKIMYTMIVMKNVMAPADIATLWRIDAGELLDGIKNEFELT